MNGRGTIGFLWLLATLGVAAPLFAGDRPITIFFVRHAEAALSGPAAEHGDPKNPPLTQQGRRRAADLARTLGDVGIEYLFATEYQRTSLTLQPLADRVDKRITKVSAHDGATQVAALRKLPTGSIAIVAGHSNTIPGMVCDLGGPTEGLDCEGRQLPHEQHDRLYVVILPAAGDATAPRSLTLSYGE